MSSGPSGTYVLRVLLAIGVLLLGFGVAWRLAADAAWTAFFWGTFVPRASAVSIALFVAAGLCGLILPDKEDKKT